MFFGDDASTMGNSRTYWVQDHATDAIGFLDGYCGSRMTVDSAGIDVSGTVSADGLTVEANTNISFPQEQAETCELVSTQALQTTTDAKAIVPV